MMKNWIIILLSFLAIFTSCIPGRDNIYDIKAGNFVPDNNPPITSISPGPGIYNQPQSVVMTANESALIYYTLDGSVPTIDSTRYTGYLVIANDSTLKYFAEDERGNREDVREAAYTFDYSVPTVTIVSLSKNSYNTTDTVNISIQGSEFGTLRIMHGGNSIDTGKLVYETDYAGGAVVNYSFPATILQNGTDYLRVYLKDSAGNMGSTSQTVTYDGTIPETTPNPPSGNYITLPASISLSSSEAAIIYYTLNSDEPDTSSPQYSGPIPVTGNLTLKYFSVDTAGNEEEVKTSQYLDNSSSTTTASPAGGRYNPYPGLVYLTTTETGADIYYTINGDDPTSGSLLYTGEIDIITDTILKFISIDRAGNIEAIKTEQYIIDLVNPIIIISSVIPAQIGGTQSSDLNWNSSEPGLYRVERGGSGWGNGILISSGSYTSGDKTVTVSGLSLGEGVNNINIYLKDEAGNIGADSINIDRNDIPRNVLLTGSFHTITISWNPVPDAISYRLYWKQDTTVSKTDYHGIIDNVTSPYIHNDLIDDLPYSYIITSINSSEESISSDEISGIPRGAEINLKAGDTDIPSENGVYTFSSPFSPVIFKVQNIGNLNLDITSVTALSGNISNFIITQPEDSTISALSDTTFSIEFRPDTSGNKSAVISIQNTDINESNYTFTINGSSTLPCVSFDPALNAANIAVDQDIILNFDQSMDINNDWSASIDGVAYSKGSSFIAWTNSNHKLTINPSYNFTRNKNIIIKLTGFKDSTNAYNLSEPTESSFTIKGYPTTSIYAVEDFEDGKIPLNFVGNWIIDNGSGFNSSKSLRSTGISTVYWHTSSKEIFFYGKEALLAYGPSFFVNDNREYSVLSTSWINKGYVSEYNWENKYEWRQEGSTTFWIDKVSIKLGDSAYNTGLNSDLFLKFSEPINKTNGWYVTIDGNNYNNSSTDVTFNTDGTELAIQVPGYFSRNKTVNVSVNDFIALVDSQPLTGSTSSSFITYSTLPTVALSPANNAKQVSLDANIILTFNETMRTDNGWYVTVNGITYNQSSSESSWNNKILTINPTTNFNPSSTVSVVLNNFVSQYDDTPLAGSTTISFNTTNYIKIIVGSDTIYQNSLNGKYWKPFNSSFDTQKKWPDANTACNSLAYAGRSEWRLATIAELQSISGVNFNNAIFGESSWSSEYNEWEYIAVSLSGGFLNYYIKSNNYSIPYHCICDY